MNLLSAKSFRISSGYHREYLKAGAGYLETNIFRELKSHKNVTSLSHLAYAINFDRKTSARSKARRIYFKNPDQLDSVADCRADARTASLSPDVNESGYEPVTSDQLAEAYGDRGKMGYWWRSRYYSCETIFEYLMQKHAALCYSRSILRKRQFHLKSREGWNPNYDFKVRLQDASGRTYRRPTTEAFLISVSQCSNFLSSRGLMCLGAKEWETLFESISPAGTVFVSAYPNAGLQWIWTIRIKGANEMADQVPRFFLTKKVLNILVAAVGTTPEILLLLPRWLADLSQEE